MKCTICGAENLEGAAYCEDCGSKLPTSPPPAEVVEMEEESFEEEPFDMDQEPEMVEEMTGEGIVCAACGTENPAGSRFCDDCGASLDAVEEDVEEDVEELESEAETETEEPPETPVGMAKLVVQGYDQEYLLDKDIITLGRESPADGIFPDIDLTDVDEEAYVSRRHAQIIRKDDGFLFEDLGSSNGSFINNVRIAQGVQQFLNENDVIRLGKTVMTLVKE
ncbi:MAG: FHA domain-containing protein [Vulcanimicrobiota bacterium]